MDTTQPTSSTGQAKLQSRIRYFSKGFFSTANNVFNAIIEWGADDRIRLFVMTNDDVPKPAQVVFDIMPSDIAKVSTFMTHMFLRLKNGNKYDIDFASGAMAIGGISVAAGILVEHKSGIKTWIKSMKATNIPTQILGYARLFKLIFIAIGIWLVLYAIVFFNTNT